MKREKFKNYFIKILNFIFENLLFLYIALKIWDNFWNKSILLNVIFQYLLLIIILLGFILNFSQQKEQKVKSGSTKRIMFIIDLVYIISISAMGGIILYTSNNIIKIEMARCLISFVGTILIMLFSFMMVKNDK